MGKKGFSLNYTVIQVILCYVNLTKNLYTKISNKYEKLSAIYLP